MNLIEYGAIATHLGIGLVSGRVVGRAAYHDHRGEECCQFHAHCFPYKKDGSECKFYYPKNEEAHLFGLLAGLLTMVFWPIILIVAASIAFFTYEIPKLPTRGRRKELAKAKRVKEIERLEKELGIK